MTFFFFKASFFFFFFWLCWVFVSVRGLFLVAASRGHSSSRCAGLSLSRPLLLQSTSSRRAGSVVVAHGPSCPAACGIFPGLKPVSPALAGRFSTTAPPGKPILHFLNVGYHIDRFVDVEPTLHPWNKSHLMMMYDTLTILLNSVCKYFVEDFCIYINKGY